MKGVTLDQLRATGLDLELGPVQPRQAGKRARPEGEFLDEVMAYAKAHGWLRAHFRPAMIRGGKWVTAVQGEGAGFPDLILVRGERIVVAELKAGKNKPTPEQVRWLEAFRAAGVPAYVWRPEDWAEIRAVLTADTTPPAGGKE